MNTHLIKALTVLIFLIVSWSLGTYFVAKRANGARERRFIFRSGIIILLGILGFSALDYFVLKSSGAGIGVILFFTFLILRRRQLQIRREEANA